MVGGSGSQGGAGGQGGNGGAGQGGAIFNDGTLTLNRCTFTVDLATGGKGGDDLAGGSVIGGNGGAGQGGAVFNNTGRTLAINNCTFGANSAGGGAGGNARVNGGGIGNIGGDGGNGVGGALFNQGTMIVTAGTSQGNTGTGGAAGTSDFNGISGTGSGGLITGSGAASTLRNSISAGNTGSNGGAADVGGAFVSDGYNLIGNGDGSTGFTGTADQVGTTASPLDARLGPLQINGGPTDTMALLANSPALDKGKSFGLSTDQRGVTRPFDDPAIANASGGDGSDIGAFELRGPVSAVSRKLHGSFMFDIDLPLTGTAGIECRTGGMNSDHQVIMNFPSPISLTSASVTAGTGTVSNFTISGGQVTGNLTGVVNAQTVILTLFGVNNGTTTSDVSVPMGVLLGDTNGDRVVNSGDSTQTKNRAGQTTDATNFRSDVTKDGVINSADSFIVKSRAGTSLP